MVITLPWDCQIYLVTPGAPHFPNVVTSILASVVIFIHCVSSQFPGGRKPREHLNGFDSQLGSQEYYKLDTRRDFISTTEILLYIRLGQLVLEYQLVLLWLGLEAIQAANQTRIKQSLISGFMTGLQTLSLQNIQAHLCS